MSEERELIGSAVSGLLQSHAMGEKGPARDRAVWSALSANGFTSVGDDLEIACDIVRICAASVVGAGMPIGMTTVAAPWLRAAAGFPAVEGTVAIARDTNLIWSGSQLTGQADQVLFALDAQWWMLIASDGDGHTAALQTAADQHPELTADPASARTGVPEATLRCTQPVVLDPVEIRTISPETLTGLEVVLGAVATLQIAGALKAVLDLTVRYAHERHQFGKAIAEFQMVKSHLAALAGEVMAAEAAADAVPRLLADPLHHEIALRSVRLRAAQSAGAAARIAHQIHGTIGVTAEYPLHVFTRQLWLWRDFDVTEGASQERLGLALARHDERDLWRLLVDGPGPSADHDEGGEDHG